VDFGPAAKQAHLERLKCEQRVVGMGQRKPHDQAREDVLDKREEGPPSGYSKLGGVGHPNLVWAGRLELFHYVGISLVLMPGIGRSNSGRFAKDPQLRVRPANLRARAEDPLADKELVHPLKAGRWKRNAVVPDNDRQSFEIPFGAALVENRTARDVKQRANFANRIGEA